MEFLIYNFLRLQIGSKYFIYIFINTEVFI
jgi:hypothetical protein